MHPHCMPTHISTSPQLSETSPVLTVPIRTLVMGSGSSAQYCIKSTGQDVHSAFSTMHARSLRIVLGTMVLRRCVAAVV